MAHVLIDLRHVLPRPTGIGTYLAGLARAVAARRDRPRLMFLCNDSVQESLVRDCTGVEVIPFPYPVYGIREQAALVVALARLRPAVAHFPHLGHPVGPLAGARLVLTIHDLIPEVFPEFYLPAARLYRRVLLRSARRRAAWVTTPSEFSKADLIGRLRFRADRITVVHPGRPTADRTSWVGPSESEGLLYIGNLKPHKDVPVLLDAWARVRARGWGIPLRLTGTESSLMRLNPAVGRIPPGVEFLGDVKDAELSRVLSRARILVLPSRYEGFGFPLLEAMSAGVPTLAAAASSLPEVGLGAAVYFAPGSAEDLADRIVALYSDPTSLERHSRLGRERAAAFDWDDSAERLLRVYERVLTDGRREGE